MAEGRKMTEVERAQVASMLQGSTRGGKQKLDELAAAAQIVVDGAEEVKTEDGWAVLVCESDFTRLKEAVAAMKRDDA